MVVMMMSRGNASRGARKSHAATRTEGANDGRFRKHALSDATLEGLATLVAGGGKAGHAAREMLNTELLGADAEYASRIARSVRDARDAHFALHGFDRSEMSIAVPHSAPVSRWSKLWTHIRVRIFRT
jgi:hypothetical protein